MKVECNFKNCCNTFDYKSNKKYCSRRCKNKKNKDIRSPKRQKRLEEYKEETFGYQKV